MRSRFALALMFAVLATPALAIDFSKPLVDEAGKPVCATQLKEGEDCPAGKTFTLAIVARNALYASYEDEKNLSGDEKFKRAELAQTITAGDVKLKVEDVALVKKLIGKMYGPVVVYQAWRELDATVK